MKRILFYLIAVIIVGLGCSKSITEDDLKGLWIAQNPSEHSPFHQYQLFFSGDSMLDYSLYFRKYDLSPKEIIFHTSDTLYPFTHQPYQLKDETLIFSYTCDYCFLGTSYQYFKKSHHQNLIEAYLDSTEITIDFPKFIERSYYYHPESNIANHSIGNFFVGFDKDNPSNVIVIHNNRKVSLDSFEHEFKNELENYINVYPDYKKRWIYSSLYIDKNLSFSDYSYFKRALLSFGIYETNVHLSLNYTSQKLPEDFRYYTYRPITFLISNHEMETISFPKTPPDAPSLSNRAIASNTISDIHVSWNDNNEIFINNELTLKDDFYLTLEKKYKENIEGSIFTLSPSPNSKLDTYLSVRNDLYQIYINLRDHFLYKNHPLIPRDHPLPLEVQKEINDKFPFVERLNYSKE